MAKPKVTLSIAGSDSSGGAGIQADLKAFSYLGVHGTTVLTCVTAQNTQHVGGIFKVPVSMIEQQLQMVCEDFSIAAVKTGMLYDAEIVNCVVRNLSKYRLKPVVDPVMVATSGDTLSQESLVDALKKRLFPHALMVTANVPEAAELAGISIHSLEDVHLACKKIASYKPQYILVKGGHLQGDAVVDVLYDGKQFHEFSLPRIPKKKAHGSGCTLSALITGLLALGETPVDAVRKAKPILWSMIHEGYAPGKGSDALNHSSSIIVPPTDLNDERFSVWLELRTAVEDLLSFLPSSVVAEVGMNIVYALPSATTKDQVCAVEGRIVKGKERPHLCGSLQFGASKHVASIVLAAMSHDAKIRSALNIRYSNDTVERCRKVGLRVGSFDRKDEPRNALSTMEWGTNHVIKTLGYVPDIIYDLGAVGKEPMIRILGTSPQDVLRKLRQLF